MATSSRSLALCWGFWLVHPSFRLRILRTCSGWKLTWKWRSTRSATRGGPQLGPPAVGLGPLRQQGFQPLAVGVGESGRPPGVGFGGELSGVLAGELHPGGDGGAAATEEVSDLVEGFPSVDEFNGPQAAALQLLGCADGSHTVSTRLSSGLFA